MTTPPQLPALPGVDPQLPLQRLEGDVALYAWMLSTFGDEQKRLLPRIGELMQQPDQREPLTRLVHTSKGQAATIGAQALTDELRTLEDLLKHGAAQPQCEAKLDTIQNLLLPLLAAIDQAQAQLHTLMGDGSATPPPR